MFMRMPEFIIGVVDLAQLAGDDKDSPLTNVRYTVGKALEIMRHP